MKKKKLNKQINAQEHLGVILLFKKWLCINKPIFQINPVFAIWVMLLPHIHFLCSCCYCRAMTVYSSYYIIQNCWTKSSLFIFLQSWWRQTKFACRNSLLMLSEMEGHRSILKIRIKLTVFPIQIWNWKAVKHCTVFFLQFFFYWQ